MTTSLKIPPRYLRSEALGKEITELCGYIYAATYQLLVKIREFDEQGLWQLDGILSCAHWLNWQCGTGMNAAREKVRVARALAKLPLTSAAFEKGQLSYSKVRAITRVGTSDNEQFLLQIARHGTASHLETVVRGYRQVCRTRDARNADKQHEQRDLNCHWDDDGSLVIRGRLPAEAGAAFLKALEKAVDDLPADHQRDESGKIEAWAPISQRRADALAHMGEVYAAQDSETSSSSADRYQVMVHVVAESDDRVSAETSDAHSGQHAEQPAINRPASGAHLLAPDGDVSAETSAPAGPRKPLAKPGRAAGWNASKTPLASSHFDDTHLEHGPHVSAETSRRLCCDAAVSTLVEDRYGHPLNIGRKSRTIPAPMRRALNARDRGCRFPGCSHRHVLDGHHIRHWADGGETGLDNLVLLCRYHHRLLHEGGFSCAVNADGELSFRQPGGRLIPPSGYLTMEINLPLIAHLKEKLEDREIDHRTCRSHWDGTRMDKYDAVELLDMKTNGVGVSAVT